MGDSPLNPSVADASRGAFPFTHWSLVERAGGAADGAVRREALIALLKRYLAPLKGHLMRQWRADGHRAEDLLQGFLLSRVLESDLIARADRERGKFRTFLLAALDNYVANELRRDRAIKRQPNGIAVDVSEISEPLEGDAAPDESFDADWARQVIAQTTRRMREACLDNGRRDVWEAFEARVLGPTLDGAEPPSNDELAARFGLASPQQVSNLVVTGKRMFARALRTVVGSYEVEEGQIEAEVAELQKALAGAQRPPGRVSARDDASLAAQQT
jgi:RNA polymerase sigma-70 factor (ECF subfamily)